jgi:hypothetical protein
MNTYRKRAIIVGVLFITATVASSLYYVILDPILNAPDYLIKVSGNETPWAKPRNTTGSGGCWMLP